MIQDSIVSMLKSDTDIPAENKVLWVCSPTMQSALESMGVYEIVKKEMEVIANSPNGSAIKLSKIRLDAISKSITIMKNVVDTATKSGAIDDDDSIEDIQITFQKEEGLADDDEPEDDEITLS